MDTGHISLLGSSTHFALIKPDHELNEAKPNYTPTVCYTTTAYHANRIMLSAIHTHTHIHTGSVRCCCALSARAMTTSRFCTMDNRVTAFWQQTDKLLPFTEYITTVGRPVDVSVVGIHCSGRWMGLHLYSFAQCRRQQRSTSR